MKAWLTFGVFAVCVATASADTATLINTLPSRPVFTVLSSGVTVTRTVAPGTRIAVEAGLFSGLGGKRLPLEAGATYYLARVGASAALYRLADDQVLVLNQSGRAVSVAFVSDAPVDARLASGNWALGALGSEGLDVAWAEDESAPQGVTLTQPGVYRLVLASPDGVGVVVSLEPWD